MNDRPNIHGQSLIGLLENEPEDRIVFAQAHEAVGVPCLMARQGKIQVHLYPLNEDQLFDVPADPDEWNNLIASEEHSTVAAGMRSEILNRFDPDRMADEKPGESIQTRLYS